jgi:hypothetical protein
LSTKTRIGLAALLTLISVFLPAVALAGHFSGRVLQSRTVGCKSSNLQPAELQAMLNRAVADGETLIPAAVEQLRNLAAGGPQTRGAHLLTFAYLPDPASPASGVATSPVPTPSNATTSSPPPAPQRSLQAHHRATVSDHASLGCPVGDSAHVWWQSGEGAISDVFHWGNIGGGSGTDPEGGYCGGLSCTNYGWDGGAANYYYQSVDVYNSWYAHITSAGCGY